MAVEILTMIRRACALGIVAVVAIVSIRGGYARAEDLEQAWSAALAADQRLQASRAQTEASRWDFAAARARYVPTLSNKSGYTFLTSPPNIVLAVPPIPPVQAEVLPGQFLLNSTMVSMPLYSGGQIWHSVNAAAAQISAAEQNEARTALDVKLDVAAAYVTVLRTRRGAEVAVANVTSLESHEKTVGDMFNQGMVAKNDLLAAQVALADARQRTIQADNNVDIAQAAYNRLLGRPLTDPVDIEELGIAPVDEDLEGLTAQAIRCRPEVAQLAAQMNALRCQSTSVRGATKPQLSANGGFIYLDNTHVTPNGYGAFTFQLDWTPYDGGASRSKSNSLLEQANALARLRDDAITAISLQVRQAWLDEQETRKRIDVTSKAIDCSEENLRVVVNRFQQGVGTNTEVLDAETLRTLSYTNYYDAVCDAVLATFRLHRAVGNL